MTIPSSIADQQAKFEAANTTLSHVSAITGPATLSLMIALFQTAPVPPPSTSEHLTLRMTPGTYVARTLVVDQYAELVSELQRVFALVRQPLDLEPELKALIYARMSDAYL